MHQNQVHDFNLGIAASGLFWTAPLPAGAVAVRLGAGQARMQAANLAVTDDFTLANALFGTGPPPVPATVSFNVSWSGVAHRLGRGRLTRAKEAVPHARGLAAAGKRAPRPPRRCWASLPAAGQAGGDPRQVRVPGLVYGRPWYSPTGQFLPQAYGLVPRPRRPGPGGRRP